MTFEELKDNILDQDKKKTSTPNEQLLAMMNSLGRVSQGQAINNDLLITEGLGELLVSIISFCDAKQISLPVVASYAWNKIEMDSTTLNAGN